MDRREPRDGEGHADERRERDARELEARELERAMHAAFMRLPTETAPRSLLPRVMAAASPLRDRPWYARSWHTWPHSWQVASLAFCLIVLAIASVPIPATAGRWWSAVAAPSDGALTTVVTLAEDAGRAARLADSLGATAVSVWRTFCAPLLLYATTISVLVCAALGLFAVALERLIPGKASY